jgi:hypothetical protein
LLQRIVDADASTVEYFLTLELSDMQAGMPLDE